MAEDEKYGVQLVRDVIKKRRSIKVQSVEKDNLKGGRNVRRYQVKEHKSRNGVTSLYCFFVETGGKFDFCASLKEETEVRWRCSQDRKKWCVINEVKN